MLNLFQHLIKSISYETLKQVRGDKKGITTQSPWGEGWVRLTMMHFSLRMIHFYCWALRLVQIIITFMSYYHLLIGS